jgi:hypothetical protein
MGWKRITERVGISRGSIGLSVLSFKRRLFVESKHLSTVHELSDHDLVDVSVLR